MDELIAAVKKNRYMIAANAVVTLLILVLAIFGLILFGLFRPLGPDSSRFNFIGQSREEDRIVSVVRSSNPAVVSIIITKSVSAGGLFEAMREVGGGTGFLVSPDGLIVTNKHVVDDEDADYAVYTFDGKKYDAEVAAKDPTQDIAVLRIRDGREFPYLSFGDSSRLALGQTVIAIGNVFDQFKNSVSVGVVSGLSRSIVAGDNLGNTELLDNVIQTDAAINPGNSGGPLLDMNDRVVGVNVAIARGSDSVGFALPSNMVKSAVNSVLRNGRIVRPYLGVRYIQINEIVKDELDLPFDYGVLVSSENEGQAAVNPGSPADRAGISGGDIILEVDGKELNEVTTLAGIFQTKNVGDIIELKFWHDGRIHNLKVKLGEFPI